MGLATGHTGVRIAAGRHWLHDSASAPASFLRFVLVGGTSNLLYVLAFAVLAEASTQLANAVGFLASTALANELHRWRTFRARGSVRWYTAQLEGGGLALAGLLATSAALAGAQHLAEPSTTVQVMLVVAITGLVGLVRFLALRAWFRPGGEQP